jgi:type VI protein secretion system component VasK
MKRKIITYLLILLIVSALGAAFAASYIGNTTSTLSHLVNLHQIADVRQHLVMSIQTVQSELYTVHTNLAHRLDLITEHVSNLEKAAQKCSTCHHTPVIAGQIDEVQSKIIDYRNALNIYISTVPNSPGNSRLKLDAASIGNQLLFRTEEISVKAEIGRASCRERV